MNRQSHDARLFQLHVRSDWPLPGLPVQDSQPDLELRRGEQRPFMCRPETRLYANHLNAASRPFVEFHRQDHWHCLHYPDVASFYFAQPDRVLCVVEKATDEQLVTLVLGPLCAVLLELRGLPCLHASCVRVGAAAVAFAAPSGAGKSTLARHFVDAGCPLLADDVLPLRSQGDRVIALPAFPELKLAAPGDPPQSEKLRMRLPHAASFNDYPVPLSCLFLIERQADPQAIVRSTPLSPAEGLLELMRHSFCARLASLLQLDRRRFPLLAEIAARIRVFRLVMPTAQARLAEVRETVLADCKNACSPSEGWVSQ